MNNEELKEQIKSHIMSEEERSYLQGKLKGRQEAQIEMMAKVEELKEKIRRNGNLKNRIVKYEDNGHEEFIEKHDEVLTNIVLDYIDEVFKVSSEVEE